MRLLLIRHGQTPSNVDMLLDTATPGAELDETGHSQAAALANHLDGIPLDAIYVSDLVRTQQTAAPLASARGIAPVVLGGLREIQAGDLEMGTDWAPYVEVLAAWRHDLTVRMPGSESGAEFLGRFDAAVAAMAASGHEHVAAVSHGAALRVWTSARCPNVTPDFLMRVGVPNTTVIRLEGHPETGWVARQWGDHPL